MPFEKTPMVKLERRVTFSLVFLLLSSVCSMVEARPYTIGLFLSEESYYVLSMEKGFKKEMARQGFIEGQSIRYLREVMGKSRNTEKFRSGLKDKMDLEKPDLLVPFGTPASILTHDLYPAGSIPVIFSGLTDPRDVGCGHLRDQVPKNNITGVIYSVPPESLYRFISKILPDCSSLGYIFYSSFSPDLSYKAILQSNPVPNGLALEFIELSPGDTIPKKYLEKCQVFLGWYGLYKFQKYLSDKQPDKVFIGTNISQIKEGALAVIAPSDVNLGEEAALMVRDVLLHRKNVSTLSPRYPSRFLIGVNLKKGNELGIGFPSEIVVLADEVIE